MAIIKRMSSKATIPKIEKYLKQNEKTQDKLISSMNCDSENFAKQCQVTNLLYNKNQNDNDRKYYHIIQSFSPNDNVKLTHEQAHEIGIKFAEINFKRFEVLVVTHKDKDHIHTHFVVNSVSLENGKKYRADNKSLWKMRNDSNQLCKENNLIHSIQSIGKRVKEKITSGELRKALRGDDLWKTNLKAQISEASGRTLNMEQFKKEMLEKYKVEVQERSRKSKGKKEVIIEYKPQGNRKFCPENRLGSEYGKESIDGVIRGNEEKARATSERAKTGEPIRTGAIEQELRNRASDITAREIEQREQELTRFNKESTSIGEKDRGTKERDRYAHRADRER